jgi:hypothetical protein
LVVWGSWSDEPLPAWLREDVEAVLGDLQQTAPLDLRVGYLTSNGSILVQEQGEKGWLEWGPDDGVRGAELRVDFADYLQDQFFPESRGAWGEARPQCPGHPHPAEAEEIEGEAWWTCPVEGRQIARIGELGRWS